MDAFIDPRYDCLIIMNTYKKQPVERNNEESLDRLSASQLRSILKQSRDGASRDLSPIRDRKMVGS